MGVLSNNRNPQQTEIQILGKYQAPTSTQIDI